MAYRNIIIKRKTTSGLDFLYPQTKVVQVKKDATTLMDNFAQNLLTKSNPGVNSFIKVGTDGSVNYVNSPSDIGASATIHPEAISNFGAGVLWDGLLTLQQWLDIKVPLVDGKIPAQYFPEWVRGHMQFYGTVVLNDTTGLSLSTISTAMGNVGLDTENKTGRFLIVTTAGFLTADSTYNFASTVDEVSESSPRLKVGDWIIFVGKVDGVEQYKFAILNNTYTPSTIDKHGIFKLSDPTGKTKRSDLSDTTSNEKIVTESVLRAVLKNFAVMESDAKFGFTQIDLTAYNALTTKIDLSGGVTTPVGTDIMDAFLVFSYLTGLVDDYYYAQSQSVGCKYNNGSTLTYWQMIILGDENDLIFEQTDVYSIKTATPVINTPYKDTTWKYTMTNNDAATVYLYSNYDGTNPPTTLCGVVGAGANSVIINTMFSIGGFYIYARAKASGKDMSDTVSVFVDA